MDATVASKLQRRGSRGRFCEASCLVSSITFPFNRFCNRLRIVSALSFRSAVAVSVPCTERERKKWNSILFERMKKTANVRQRITSFLRKLRNYYGILTDKRNY